MDALNALRVDSVDRPRSLGRALPPAPPPRDGLTVTVGTR